MKKLIKKKNQKTIWVNPSNPEPVSWKFDN
jgi:hypothetical protein